MKPSFRLAPRAYDDLKNIARYTRQQWGEAQREKYVRAPDERLRWLAEHPHLIFHLIGTDAIDIIGVPHRHLDVPGYFGVSEPQVLHAPRMAGGPALPRKSH